MVARIVKAVEGLQARIKLAAWVFGLPKSLPSTVETAETLEDYLINRCGFTPGEVALKDLPPLVPQTVKIWWKEAVLPYLEREKRNLAATPLWEECQNALSRRPDRADRIWSKDYHVWDELKRRCKSALSTVSKRRDDREKCSRLSDLS